jgi:hypothetical protein
MNRKRNRLVAYLFSIGQTIVRKEERARKLKGRSQTWQIFSCGCQVPCSYPKFESSHPCPHHHSQGVRG